MRYLYNKHTCNPTWCTKFWNHTYSSNPCSFNYFFYIFLSVNVCDWIEWSILTVKYPEIFFMNLLTIYTQLPWVIESKWYIVHKLTLGSEILYFDKETTDHRSYANGKHSFCSFPWDLSLILMNVLTENVERCLTLLHGERILDRPQHKNSSLKTI